MIVPLMRHLPRLLTAVTHQSEVYYRDATYADCPKLFERWQTCMRAKLKKPDEAEAMLRAESRAASTGHHIFQFQAAYTEEACARYGIEKEVGK
eukprot:CAMPEP_0115836442 /NCGR_PEP_ID=MMETSP0287-20121206/4708_1 /TAXON_ID=412157 /ORGANISM="Chrysochromulina rotalis, Strain UIO044" /LENGTH=93 /DNA_ID=CAMNT_0003289923 /DNA_START=79 /DNA_END=360 /DNA_ORIENTATION=-